MNEPILHHFDWSPYAEKVRVLLGIKGLAWRSVQIPMVMPKPDLTALTGGYRKTPVLQIGADIYCDTSCIARELEARYPERTLFPDGGRGLALALAGWADRFFEPGAGLSMGLNDQLPADLVQDRREFFTHMDFSSFGERTPHMFGQVLAQAELVESQLADGRAFLSGDRPGLVDATAYYVFWMLRGFIARMPAMLEPFGCVAGWEQRVRAIGHGQRTDIEATEALAVARAATPLPGTGVVADDPSGLSAGQRVTVTPDDYGKVPVSGELATLDGHRISICRHDPRAGKVVVHFPRLGYVVGGGMIEVHFYPSPNGLKVPMMLEECGLPYRLVEVNILRGAQFEPDFMRISPNNRIPAIVDLDAPGGPLPVFESGAILQYLAEKSGQLLPREVHGRYEVLQWVCWQVAGLGPMAGQAHHFRMFAKEQVPYGVRRYTDEMNRLYGVLERQLSGREYIAGEYSIADVACFPWIVHHEWQGQSLDDFPALKRWFATVRERPATQRAYEKGHVRMADADAYRFLYGQTAHSVDRQRKEHER